MTQDEFNEAIRAAFNAGVSWGRQNTSPSDYLPFAEAQTETAAAEVASTYWNRGDAQGGDTLLVESWKKPLGGRRIRAIDFED